MILSSCTRTCSPWGQRMTLRHKFQCFQHNCQLLRWISRHLLKQKLRRFWTYLLLIEHFQNTARWFLKAGHLMMWPQVQQFRLLSLWSQCKLRWLFIHYLVNHLWFLEGCPHRFVLCCNTWHRIQVSVWFLGVGSSRLEEKSCVRDHLILFEVKCSLFWCKAQILSLKAQELLQ